MSKDVNPTGALTDEMADEIVAAVADGMTVREWFELHSAGRATYAAYANRRISDQAFADRIDAARELGCEALIEDVLVVQLSAGRDHRLANAANKTAATVFKAAEMLSPKRFAPKLQHTGPGGEALSVKVVHHAVHSLPTDEAHRQLKDENVSRSADAAPVKLIVEQTNSPDDATVEATPVRGSD